MSAQPRLHTAPKVRLGFVGLGWIGRKRLDAVAADRLIEIAALYDDDIERARSACEGCLQAQVASSLDDMLACDLDGIVIATPNSLHAEQAIACLSAGKAVFCQKPLATTTDDTVRVVAAARSADRLLGIDYSYRHVQGMGELRRRIRGGELGRLTFMDLRFHNAYGPDKPWCYERRMSGGGCLLDLGIHLIDLASWLQGASDMELVSCELFCKGQPARSEDVEDFACMELRATSASRVRIVCSWNAHAGADASIGFELFGTQAGATWRNVGGSFYDFELDVCRGTSRERIGSHPDEWGGRGLLEWAQRLSMDSSFDPAALDIVQGARLVEAVYRR